LQHPIFPLDSSASAFYGHQPQQNEALNANISNGTVTQSSVDPLQLPPLNGFSNTVSQVSNFDSFLNQKNLQKSNSFVVCLFVYFQYTMFGEDDLQTIVQMGFGNRETPLQPQSFHGEEKIMRKSVFL
jgi:hypothetical protein